MWRRPRRCASSPNAIALTHSQAIRQKFGGLQPKIDAGQIIQASGEYPSTSMRDVYRHFPPVVHRWSLGSEAVQRIGDLPPPLLAPAPLPSSEVAAGGRLPRPKLFSHELLQSFSFHLFAKRPIERVVDRRSLRRDLMRRMSLSALQIRFNVLQRQDPLFTFIDFNQMNWPREGCAVCSLDLTTDATRWRDAVFMAVLEVFIHPCLSLLF